MNTTIMYSFPDDLKYRYMSFNTYQQALDCIKLLTQINVKAEVKVWTITPRIEVARLHQPWQITVIMLICIRRLGITIILRNTQFFHRLSTTPVENYHLTVEKVKLNVYEYCNEV